MTTPEHSEVYFSSGLDEESAGHTECSAETQEDPAMPVPRIYDVTIDQRLGRWLVLQTGIRKAPTPAQAAKGHCGFLMALVQCDCGTTKTVRVDVLARGASSSCGCYTRELSGNRLTRLRLKHGLHLHPVTADLYGVWTGVVKRTTDPQHRSYRNYGARGIQLCDAWRDPARFTTDLLYEIGPRPAGLELDRINNSLGYQPGNVRWVTRSVNCLNRRPASEWRAHPVDCGCASCKSVRKRAKGAA